MHSSFGSNLIYFEHFISLDKFLNLKKELKITKNFNKLN